MGHDFLAAVNDGNIKENNIVLMVSLDGVQLYKSKASDCWIYIWFIINLSPDKHYHKAHIFPGEFIPGPNKPKNVDSFCFPGMHHVAALQNEGLVIWDASHNVMFHSDLYLLFPTVDGPGLTYWHGMVGHSGKSGCRVYCGVKGRTRTDGNHYYPTLLKPRDFCSNNSDHNDINVLHLPPGGSAGYKANLRHIVSAPGNHQQELHMTETRITKLPLILGLACSRSLGIPLCMTTDIMHLANNLSDLLISLWRGTLQCYPGNDKDTWDWAVFTGDNDAWQAHGV
ncbi:hypothetical protein BDN67DRAFT_877344, partial [Paxillus ammoniavirescens]